MRPALIKFFLRHILWLLPFISLMIFGAFLVERNENDYKVATKELNATLKKGNRRDVELPLISICSRNQFSQRDADKIMEMEEWRGLNLEYYRQLYYYRNITLNATEFMSIFRNFAMYKMDPNEIENFTEDQKEFLGYHRIEFSKLIEHQVRNHLIIKVMSILMYNPSLQVVPSCDELIMYCNYKGQDRICTDLFKMEHSLDGFCCTLKPHMIDLIDM